VSPWTPTTLVRVDDDYDREMADRGSALSSRLGHYLAKNLDNIFEDERADPVIFARWAWSVATGPIMSPGYVRTRPDLRAVHVQRSSWDGTLYVAVDVPLPHHRLTKESRPPYEVRDWERDRYTVGGEYAALEAPDDSDKDPRATLLTTTELRVPATGWELHQPGDWRIQELLIDDAKQTLALLVDQINRHLGPKVAALLGDPGGSW
jgi:hypothetical protein